jgi:hypothetical protein
VLPIFVEVGLCAIGEKDPPGFLEVAAPRSKPAEVPEFQSPGSEPG